MFVIGLPDKHLQFKIPAVEKAVVDYRAHHDLPEVHRRTGFEAAQRLCMQLELAAGFIRMNDRRVLQPGKFFGLFAFGGRVHTNIVTGQQGAQPGDISGGNLWLHHPESTLVSHILTGVADHTDGDRHPGEIVVYVHLGHLANHNVLEPDLGLARFYTRGFIETDSDGGTCFTDDPVNKKQPD